MSNVKQFNLFVSRLSSSPLSRRSQRFPEDTKNYAQTIDRRKRKYSEIEPFPLENTQSHAFTIVHPKPKLDSFNLQDNPNKAIKEQSVNAPKPIHFPSTDIQPSTAPEDNSVNLLDKFLYEDEKMILNDNSVASHSFTPCSKNPNDTYLIKARIKYPEIFYTIFQSSEKDKYAFSDIFTNLNIIYFVKENAIYFWNYVSNFQLTYNEIANPIINVHITLPKPGIFSSSVNYIIVVATKEEVLILLIKQNDNNSFELHKSDFYYNSDSLIITSIASTSSRRIFLGSKNNLIWELDYSNAASFFGFGKKTKKITRSRQSLLEKLNPFSLYFPKTNYFYKMTVDNTRHLLYAITYCTNDDSAFDLDSVIDSSVSIYDLGPNDNDFIKLGEIDQESIKDNFRQNIIGINKKNQSFIIIDAVPLTRSDLKNNQLLLITRNGIRVYVKFDTEIDDRKIENEALINEIDSNIINKKRIVLRFSYSIKPIPEPITEQNDFLNPVSNNNSSDLLSVNISNQTKLKKILYTDKKTFVCYNDEVNKVSHIDIIEPDAKILNKSEFASLNLNEKPKEIISNVFCCLPPCEIHHIEKLPDKASVPECDLFSLLKRSSYSNFLYPNIKFLDADAHYSYTCMHENSTQLFLAPEEYMIMTSVEAIYLLKLRPIDLLLSVITAADADPNTKSLFDDFIIQYGIYETTFMLLFIMISAGFIFYQKKEKKISRDNSQLNYTQEYIAIKNNDRIIAVAMKYLYQIIELTSNSLNAMQTNVLERNKTQGIYSARPFFINGVPSMNMNLNQENEYANMPYGQAYVDKRRKNTNYITYAMFILISRIVRLFWEETLYFKQGTISDYIIEDTMKMHQVQYIKNLIISFSKRMREIKDPLMQKAEDLDVKMRNIENSNKLFNQSNQLENQQLQNQLINFFDFSNFKDEYSQCLVLCDKTVEILSFVEIIYETLAPQSQTTKMNVKEIVMIKFKDIYQNKLPYVLKTLLDGLYEIILNENDSISISNKLSRMSIRCPNILHPKQIELIKANLLLKYSKRTSNQDNITKKNIIDKAVKLMLSNPESIKISKIICNLCEISEVRQIIALCVTKVVYLKGRIDRTENQMHYINDYNSNQTILNNDKDNNFAEYKECLYTILKLLTEINSLIETNDFTSANKDIIPDYIVILLKDKSKEQLIQMQSDIIEEILAYDVQFIHDLLFNHLKEKNMLEDLFKINSPYVELYLNSQIEKDNSDPKRYESLYKFYLNSKNYEAAIRILLRLVNYDNNKSNDSQSYVRLEEKRVYNKHLIYSLTMLLETEKDSSRKKIFNELKIKMSYLEETMAIQYEIISWLHKIPRRQSEDESKEEWKSRDRDSDEAMNAIILLEQNKYSLEELYFDFSKKFKLYELNFKIFYEMHSRQIEISSTEIKENIQKCFRMFKTTMKSNWKESVFVLLNQLLITLIQIKTPYSSFHAMLKESNYVNCLEGLIPFTFIIQSIEAINTESIIQDGFMTYSFQSIKPLTDPINHFWLIGYLREMIQLPLWYIYSVYDASRSLEEESDIKKFFIHMSNKLMIASHWCDGIKESFIQFESEKNLAAYSQRYSDIKQFSEKKEELQKILKDYNALLEDKDLQLFLNNELNENVKAFYQRVKTNYNESIIKVNRIRELNHCSIHDINDSQIN